MHNAGAAEQAQIILRNLITTAQIDPERGTAHWESKDPQYWRWYNDKQETTAMILRALVAICRRNRLRRKTGRKGRKLRSPRKPCAGSWTIGGAAYGLPPGRPRTS